MSLTSGTTAKVDNRMWNSQERHWPTENVPVLCWDGALWVGMRIGKEWFVCDRHGQPFPDPTGIGYMNRTPQEWIYFPFRYGTTVGESTGSSK